MLDENELARYNRQLTMPDFGQEAQDRLKQAHIVIAGVGGLGCAAAVYLTAAGVGHISIVDSDTVSLSDLNRQILYSEDDIGEKKVSAAAGRLSRLNSRVTIKPVFTRIDDENAMGIVAGAQAVIDGLDNPSARQAVNAACVKLKVPYIYGGVSGWRGMMTTIIPGETPCLACFSPEGVRGGGVIGMVPAIIANIQALEAIKLLTGRRPSLAGRLLLFHGDEMKFSFYEIKRNEDCPICAPPPSGK
jgi:molybdopterin/thiamine biosynthesis adenylyltransferase